MPPALRPALGDDEWLQSFTKPTDSEDDLTLEPVFDAPIAPADFARLSP